jgi:hypothetical protein
LIISRILKRDWRRERVTAQPDESSVGQYFFCLV